MSFPTPPNAGNLQGYDYEQEHIECDWKVIYETNTLVTSYVE